MPNLIRRVPFLNNHTVYRAGLLVLVVILLLLAGFFASSESAFLSINKLRVRVLKKKKDKKARLTGKLLESKTQLLNTILIGNNIVNVAVTAVLTAVALELFGSRGVEAGAIVSTVFLLLFGEITPKTIATNHPEKIAFAFAPFLSILVKLFSPFVRFFSFITDAAASLAGINTGAKKISFTEEEIKTFIDAGAEEGVIQTDEKQMLRQVFKFADITAREIMTPRTDIVALPADATFLEVLDTAKSTGFSRFPVYKDDLDNICGILYVKDIIAYRNKASFSLADVIRPPLFILENRRISSIKKIFRENNQSVAVIIDEYSGTSGFITVEDLIREIFGDIDGIKNAVSENLSAKNFESGTEIEGSVRISELSEVLGIAIESEFYDTIAGFITERLGEIPREGMSVCVDGWKFIVTGMENKRVSKILVQKEDLLK